MRGAFRALGAAWAFLTRPRQLRQTRRVRGGLPRGHARKSEGGMAILVVVATIMVLTVLVTELTYGAQVRFMVAHHQRDRVQSYWLARSGYNIYRLVLAANRDLQKSGALEQIDAFMPGASSMMGDALWKMLPSINTGLFRMLLGAGGDADDIDEETMTEFQKTGRAVVDEETITYSRFSDKSFLEFDGDFAAEVSDHESMIYVNNMAGDSGLIQDSTTGKQIFALMSGEDNDAWFRERNLDRWELIGNLKDWVDPDNTRSAGLGGYEDALYNRLDDPYLCKNAPFDTKEEIRLVEGWQDDVFERFGDKLTVYGSGSLNMGGIDDEVLKAVIRASAQSQPTDTDLENCIETIQMATLFTNPEKYEELAEIVTNNCGIPMDTSTSSTPFKMTTSSQTFTVTSTGMAGTSSVTITAVLDYQSKGSGKLLYWRVD